MHHNRETNILGFSFTWDTSPTLDTTLPVFEMNVGASSHNEGEFLTVYRFAPYFFLHLGRHTFGLDWEWFPKTMPMPEEED